MKTPSYLRYLLESTFITTSQEINAEAAPYSSHMISMVTRYFGRYLRSFFSIFLALALVALSLPSAQASLGWTQTSAPSTGWTSIASSADGTKLAAVVNNGGIYTSADSGASWSLTSAPTATWGSIASSSDGTKLAASAEFIGIYTSTDSGASWSLTSAGTARWFSIASSSDGTKLAAVAYTGGIYTSANSGASWTLTSAGNKGWYSITSSSDGAKLAAVVFGGGIYTSTDSGVSWSLTSASSPTNKWGRIASSSDGTKLAALLILGGGGIYTSANSGASWSLTSAPATNTTSWRSIASSADGTKLAAVVSGGGIYTSADSGLNWILQSSAPARAWSSIASSSDGTKLAASGGGIWTNSGITTTAPGAPTSLIASAISKSGATISFSAPASNGGGVITSYVATASPGGTSITLSQAGSGSFTFTNLSAGTAYSFSIVANNAIGASAAAVVSATTQGQVVARISSLSFSDDGSGTGGSLSWSGSNISAVRFIGAASAYPNGYNYGSFTANWNGRLRNLTPLTTYTFSLEVVSLDGRGEMGSIVATTGKAAASPSPSDVDELKAWVGMTSDNPAEVGKIQALLTRLSNLGLSRALYINKYGSSTYLTLPRTLALTSTTSLTAGNCLIEGNRIKALKAGLCTIAFTITAPSGRTVVMEKSFTFTKR